jgi:hypothetical protein
MVVMPEPPFPPSPFVPVPLPVRELWGKCFLRSAVLLHYPLGIDIIRHYRRTIDPYAWNRAAPGLEPGAGERSPPGRSVGLHSGPLRINGTPVMSYDAIAARQAFFGSRRG